MDEGRKTAVQDGRRRGRARDRDATNDATNDMAGSAHDAEEGWAITHGQINDVYAAGTSDALVNRDAAPADTAVAPDFDVDGEGREG